MTESQTQSRSDTQQDSQQSSQGQQQGQWAPPQQLIDQMFNQHPDTSGLSSGMSAGYGFVALQEITRAYYDQAEQTIRSARRVSEIQAIAMFRQEIVSEVTAHVTRAVLAEVQRLWQSSSGSRSSSSSSR